MGHALRKEEEDAMKEVYKKEVEGRRRRGRPRDGVALGGGIWEA